MNPVSKFWLTIVMVVVLALTGCQPQDKPSTIELIVQTENLLYSAQETVKTAIKIGRIDTSSGEYLEIIEALKVADRALDASWEAYQAGDMSEADEARAIALDMYWQIRPFLVELER